MDSFPSPWSSGFSRRESFLAWGWYAVLAIAVLYPLRRAGYALLLDWTPTPEIRFEVGGVLGVHDLPLLAALKSLSLLLPGWLLQRLLLFAILWIAGIAAHATAPVRRAPARLFAGTLYAVNPFTFTRLLAGHWTLLVAYALAPFAARAILVLASEPTRRRGAVAGVWIAVLAAISVHALSLLLLLAGGCAVALVTTRERRLVGAAFGSALLVAVAGTLWWIVPAALHGPPPRSGVETLPVFSSRPVGGVSLPLTLLGLRGFWIPRFNATGPPGWHFLAVGLVALALGGAATAARDSRRVAATALLLVSAVSLVIAMGVADPATAPVARSLYRWVPGFVAFREPHKLVGLLALALACLGAVGVEGLLSGASRVSRAIALVTLALPIAYTPQMLGGLAGRLRPVEYPASWSAADRLMRHDPDRFSVLVLPWKLYLPLPFNDPGEPVANPARDYFSVPVISSEDPELGRGLAKPDDPVSRRIEGLLARHRTIERFGAKTAPFGVKYVVLIPSVYPDAYPFLFRQQDLEIILSSPGLIVFRNTAWDPRLHGEAQGP